MSDCEFGSYWHEFDYGFASWVVVVSLNNWQQQLLNKLLEMNSMAIPFPMIGNQ
jgi:hypothetical protein